MLHICTFYGEHIVFNSLRTWFGGVTTGHGVMVLAGTLLSVLSGGITWVAAAPLLLAGAIGLVWPENAPRQTGGQVSASDAVGVVSAYNHKGPTSPSPRV